MKKKRAMAASREPEYEIRDSTNTPNNIILMADGENEMLRITKTGFFVRGIPVEQDDKEAQIVYTAFKEWMVYSALTRNY